MTHVVGTAGHVDHGKSSLVRALTGIDPDRWEEERRRGMTLDLGFALLQFDDGIEAGIVDVPGHERFVHNMLAGATGMELLLLVVAANEGPKPQTREHLAILSLLDVPAAIVVLTKCDLVDDDEREIAAEVLRDELRGTVAEHAPFVAVSTVTGAGIDELRTRIHDALVALPPRPQAAPAYLAVDRAFTIAGHGTVVTGTLMQGAVAAGDALVVQPGAVPARVRGVQVFGRARERAVAGERVAANLGGVSLEQVQRGSALVDPQIAADTSFAVRFRPLPEALPLLRRRTAVRVHVGAGEHIGTLVFAGPPQAAEPLDGTLFVRDPVAAVPGQPFVVRRLSPKTVLGGGTIGGSVLPSDGSIAPEVVALRAALTAAGLTPQTVDALAARINVRVDRVAELLAHEVETEHVWALARPAAYLDAGAAEALCARALELLQAHEAEAPWAVGLTSIALARGLGLEEALLVRVLTAAAERGLVQQRRGWYATPGFQPELTAEQRAFFERAIPVDPAQPFVPQPFDPLLAEIKRSRIAGISSALDTLVATGGLVRVGEHVYRGTQVDEIRGRLVATLKAERRITASRFRDVVGTTRKYVVPLLEFFDASGVTVRDGDERALRSR